MIACEAQPDSGADGFEYSPLCEADFDEIRSLHERLLPVRYNDKFYVEACAGYGLRKAPLYSVTVRRGGRMVGFLMAQFMAAGAYAYTCTHTHTLHLHVRCIVCRGDFALV